ncbi:hypothetical protein GOP47_0001174 [Adiantum capillus-veneris]|uniref:Morc S5 domain-containing protein n=1 Tax=Adiantum capillus-veneris TaxID=13818 RepID=A0A9D4VEC2_ADICA|nr:hypothetical protein GOP47_0001174 [Adiantum capillus-veneris]
MVVTTLITPVSFNRSPMGTPVPALSCSTGALSNALIVDSDDEDVGQSSMWVPEEDHTSSDLPPDFLEPLSPDTKVFSSLPPFPTLSPEDEQPKSAHENRQFWKSGDFTAGSYEGASFATEGMDHARVHPKFLHSNATSHKWVLGAIAELLDNSVDEIRNGATFVKIDVQPNPRNGDPMLVIEDDGGGMDPDCMRRCMSLGYSAKSKLSNTIGQYGNGFKTSTMRLGADVIVFSRNQGSKPSESIGMMSYTFLTSTGQNDVVVPTVDFQIEAFGIRKLIRSSVDDWMESMQAIQDWSPYSSQAELVSQFRSMPRRQGTKVIIYNLWHDEEGCLELDFNEDPHDIQIRATSRDVKILKLAERFPSCKHYLTHRHSLRTYVSILYLRLPAKFKIFLRGTQVPHHSLQNEMMLVDQVTYRPKDVGDSKAVVTLGFVKDAKEHIDVSGFNVYHKNRLIKPFWRIWNPSDTRGRGIIAILEANFVEPAHDKQGFERTIVLSRLETRLIEMQKSYWNKNCHMIGYTNANLKKYARPPPNEIPKDTNSRATGISPADGVANAMTHADAQQLVIERTVTCVHDDFVAGDLCHGQGGTSAVMMQMTRKISFNPVRPEREERNLVPSGINSKVSGVRNSNGIVLHRHDPVQSEPGPIHRSQSVQDVPLTSVQRVVSGSNALCGPAALKSQELCSLHSSGTAPVVIDVDSPDVDSNCEDAAFDMKMIAEEMHLESGLLSRTDNASKNLLQGDNAAGSPKETEAELLIDSSIDSPPVEEVKAVPEIIGFKSCYVEDSRGIKQVEAGPTEHDMESYVQSHDLVTTAIEGCFAAPVSIIKDGTEQVELETLGKTLLENGACSEAHVPPTIELDDFFNGLEVSSNNPSSTKETGLFVQSPVSEIDLTLPDIEENVTLAYDQPPLFSSIKEQGGNEVTTGDVRNVDAIEELKNRNLATCQIYVMRDCIKAPVLSEIEAKVLPDTDAVMTDANRQEGNDQLGYERDIGNDHEKNVTVVAEQHIPENMAVVPWDAATIHDKKDCLSAVVEHHIHENMAILTQDVASFHDKKDSVSTVMEQHIHENMAIVLQDVASFHDAISAGVEQQINESMAIVYQDGSSIHDQKDFHGRIDTSCLDIVSIPTIAVVDDVTDGLVDNMCSDLSEEDRFAVAKQQIDSLQLSIEAVVVDVDDLKEQLQQQHELQHLELRNLNMELERALSRLEELRGW